MKINFKLKTDAFNSSMQQLVNKIEQRAELTISEIGAFTKYRIRQEIPKQTHESESSIQYMITTNSKGYKVVNIIEEPIVTHDGKIKPPFDLPVWMFTSPNAIGHFKTGNIQAMRDVIKNEIGPRFRRKVENNIIQNIGD